MKQILFFIPFMLALTVCHGQYNKEKLTDILTGGTSKTWKVKNASASDSFTFNKNLTAAVVKLNGSHNEKWQLNSTDNIRWFLDVGSQKYELIVSYDKAGTQFLKLVTKADKSSIYNELLLYP